MAKVDIESGIAKSLSRSPLTTEEVKELEGKGIPTLVVDHGLDGYMAEVVVNHVRYEKQRLVFQHQMTRDQLKESIKSSVKKVLSESTYRFNLEDPTDFTTI
mgnify:CR=1 FL=1